MVKKSGLKSLDQYTEAQIDQICAFSPAFSHGLQLIDRAASQDPSVQFRKRRQVEWCQAALATFFQTASTEEICLEWSRAADQLITDAFKLAFGDSPPLALFALGKLGSEELNLSSDIDILFVTLDTEADFTAGLRLFQNLLAQGTEFGFVFRVDFDLRPGGRMGPRVPTIDQVMDYYGNYGETWERLALIRLRPICGDSEVIAQTQAFQKKFVFRRHLDFTLLNDLKALRQKIHSAYGDRSTDFQIDLKLGIGGIRDAELFVHALQVIHGGKFLSLHEKRTSNALQAIENEKLLPETDAQWLRQHYWTFRHWENLVQIQNDQQTHLLPTNFEVTPPFSDLRKDTIRCDEIVSTLFGPLEIKDTPFPVDLEDQKKWLRSEGFSQKTVDIIWPELFQQSILTRNKERDEAYRHQFLFLFLQSLKEFPDTKDLAVDYLKDFLHAVRAKSTFFALFLSHENLIRQMAEIFAKSGYLAQMICHKPELIDSFIYRSQSEISQFDQAHLLESLSEKKLLSELVAGTDFLVNTELPALFSKTTETADEICKRLLSSISQSDDDNWMDIVCLGKWGGKELGLRSDLDFIFVTEHDPQESDLKRARRFLTRLTETHHRGGQIYDVDMRLRPSGKGGLIVTSKARLLHHLVNEADAWERQAYLRARCLKDSHWSRSVHQSALTRKIQQPDLEELERIRIELLKNSKSEFDLKYVEGGLVDIEFMTQISLLKHQIVPAQTSTQGQLEQLHKLTQDSSYQTLLSTWFELRKFEQLHQAIVRESGSVLSAEKDVFRLVAQSLKLTPHSFEKTLRSALDTSVSILKRLDPRRAGN